MCLNAKNSVKPIKLQLNKIEPTIHNAMRSQYARVRTRLVNEVQNRYKLPMETMMYAPTRLAPFGKIRRTRPRHIPTKTHKKPGLITLRVLDLNTVRTISMLEWTYVS